MSFIPGMTGNICGGFKVRGFPVVQSQAGGAGSSYAMPSGVVPGDLLIMFISTQGGAGAPTGWTPIASTGGAPHIDVFWRKADGTEGSSVSTTAGTAIIFRISNWNSAQPPVAGSVSQTAGTGGTPPALSPSWGKDLNLFLAGCADAEVTNNPVVVGYPSGYINDQQVNSGHVCVGAATKQSFAASDSPSAFAISGATSVAAVLIACQGN